MNSESYGLSKLPFIQNNRLYSGRPSGKSRPFSCLPNQKRKAKSGQSGLLNRIPSALVQKKIRISRRKIGIESIIDRNTEIGQKKRAIRGRRVELDVDEPIEYILYDKNDPILRDILNGVKRVKPSAKGSAFRIRNKRGSFRRPKVNSEKRGQKEGFRLHRRRPKENVNLSNFVLQKQEARVEVEPEGKMESQELFNRDEMTRCALKYLAPEMKFYEDSVYREDAQSFVDIYSWCEREVLSTRKKREGAGPARPEQPKKHSFLFLEKKELKEQKKDKTQIMKLEKKFAKIVEKKMETLQSHKKHEKTNKNEDRQKMAIFKMKQRQREEEKFKSPSERIARYMQFSSVLQKEHLMEVLELIEGVSQKEKKEDEIPIQLVCWNERVGLNRIQRVGAAYHEDIQTLLKRNCFMVYPEFLDPALKAFLLKEKIINKIDFRDRLRPTEEYYKWLLTKCSNTYDPIFLSRLALDPPPLCELPPQISRLIRVSTKRYRKLVGPASPISAAELSPYQKYWIERVLEKVDPFLVQNYGQQFRRLWKEIFEEYIQTGRKIIVDYALRYHRERRRWGIHLLRRPKLSFSQKIFEAGGYHRQFHDLWHRFFENSKRFMTKDFFGINGLSLAVHQWFYAFEKISLTELRLTGSLGHLNRALSPKEFFLFQEFYRKMVLGFLNQILIRGAYYLIKKKKVFCKEEFRKLEWGLGGCGKVDSSVRSARLSQSEIHFLLKKFEQRRERNNYEDVIELLKNLQRKDKQVSDVKGFQHLMVHTRLADLEPVRMDCPRVDLHATRFEFPEAKGSWDNHCFIREDFKMRILEGIKTNPTKEELLAQEKLERTLGTLMGLRLREILARSIEKILEFFESYATVPTGQQPLFESRCNEDMQKHIRDETHSPIFRIELVVDNGVLKLGEIQKKLIEELNAFFVGLCQSFKHVRKPKFVSIKYAKNSFEKKLMTTQDNAKTEPVLDTVLGRPNQTVATWTSSTAKRS